MRASHLRVLLAALLVPASLAGQQLSGSARGAGMADAYGALARGTAAARYNPALLGLPGNPGFGTQLPTAVVHAGTSPITLGDLAPWGGEVVPDSVKRGWLDRIPAGGLLRGDVAADVQAFGMSVGPFALTTATVAQSSLRLPREAVELLLFGNADAEGRPREFAMAGGRADGFVASVAAASFGRRVHAWGPVTDRHTLAAGVTLKYVVGQGLLALRDARGALSSEPLEARATLPTVTVNWRREDWTRSDGWGWDLGVAYQGPRLALGLAVTDAGNDFRWSLEDARVVDGRAAFSPDSSSSAFVSRRLDDPEVSDSLREAAVATIGAAVFRPTVRLSAAWQARRDLVVTGEVLRRLADAASGRLQGGGTTTAAVGAEYRPLGGVLPLRAGLRLAEGGSAWTVGTGLDFPGAASLNVAYGRQTADVTRTTLAVGMAIGAGR
jgi:hypothetical protein